ncbi:hypothetical protein Tco_0139244 [Tanacetum coccineum]
MQDDLSFDEESQDDVAENKADKNEINTVSDVDRVSKSSFMHVNDLIHEDTNHSKTREVRTQSDDPFNIYDILNGQQKKASSLEDIPSLKRSKYKCFYSLESKLEEKKGLKLKMPRSTPHISVCTLYFLSSLIELNGIK